MGQANYVVIFTSRLRSDAGAAYHAMAEKMELLATTMPGFVRMESFRRQEDGVGVTLSYWESKEAIGAWKEQAMHLRAQELGKASWYEDYRVEICRLEKAYQFPAEVIDLHGPTGRAP